MLHALKMYSPGECWITFELRWFRAVGLMSGLSCLNLREFESFYFLFFFILFLTKTPNRGTCHKHENNYKQNILRKVAQPY